MRNKIITICAAIMLATVFSACDSESFFEKPEGSDVTIDTIFSSRLKMQTLLAQAYCDALPVGGIMLREYEYWRHYGWQQGLNAEITDEALSRWTWMDSYKIKMEGFSSDWGTGVAKSDDAYDYNWVGIRECFLVAENVDRVPDMSQEEKEQVKAECKTLIALRYHEMLKRYGGVPIVRQAFSGEESMNLHRATIQEMDDYICELCNEALPKLKPVATNMKGRIHEGIPLAVMARTKTTLARPLFNADQPVMSMDDAADNSMICLMGYDQKRWRDAVDANLAVLDWAQKSGWCKLIDTGNPFDDFGRATSEADNEELLLAYKGKRDGCNDGYYQGYDPRFWRCGHIVTANALEYFHKADGTDQHWPAMGEPARPFEDYLQRCNEMEPRFKQSIQPISLRAFNNQDSQSWDFAWGNFDGTVATSGVGRSVKFLYNMSYGTDENFWFEFPLIRLAEFYLNLAEAYNELGETQNALKYLNVIRHRAGLPNVTTTDKNKLRTEIQREFNIEFFAENHRAYNVRHWRLADRDGMLAGNMESFLYNGFTEAEKNIDSYERGVAQVAYWSNKMYLYPFPLAEVNKGYLKQNPGY